MSIAWEDTVGPTLGFLIEFSGPFQEIIADYVPAELSAPLKREENLFFLGTEPHQLAC